MDTSNKNPIEPIDESSSLEGSSSSNIVEQSSKADMSSDSTESTVDDKVLMTSSKPPVKHHGFLRKLREIRGRFNIYSLLFVIVLIIACTIVVSTAMSGDQLIAPTISSQTIPSETLKQLSSSDATVGDPKRVLNVQSNAIFSGKVLIRDSLDIAGKITVGGALSLPGITVSGNSQFDQVQVGGTLGIGGDSSIQGQLKVQKNLTVTGSGTFGGSLSAPQLSVGTLMLSNDLNLTKHVIGGGGTPGRSVGSSVGGGGTGSVSGSDSGGTVNINTGSGPSAGCLVTVNFVQKYNAIPHVIISPVGSSAAGLSYYVNRTTSSFSICTLSAPPSGASFGFDYFVIG